MRGGAKRRHSSAHITSSRNFRVDTWVLRHLQVALASLGRLSRSPLSTLMTSAVIGIALALPAGLYLLLNNVQSLSGSWDGGATISIFMIQSSTDQEARKLKGELLNKPSIASVKLINRFDALEEFKQLSGFASALDSLDKNPLPNVLVVEPTEAYSEPQQAELLLRELQTIAGVENVQLDLKWVKRFHAITVIAQRGVIVLASLLGIAVILIIGNTIRLEILNRASEIEITKLIGGTNAFIRRPFLYNGLWYGLFGGFISWALIAVSLALLDNPINQLSGLYSSGFSLTGLGFDSLLILLLGSGLLGLSGSWIAVSRHLSQIEPS